MARTLASFCLALALVAVSCKPALPSVIEDEIAKTPRGQVTLVFFTDFECPFCRRTHAALAPLLAQREGRVRLVVRHVPLRMHPDARTAARAAVCVEALSPSTFVRYVDALMTSADLSEQTCAEIAVQHGVDRDRYERCVRDPSTDGRIAHDGALFDAVGGDGVPLIFVGHTRLEGAQPRGSLEAALDSEK